MEKIRNWYKIHIVPVLPCLRMNKRGTIYIAVVLSAVLLALNLSQLVWRVSREIEAEDAAGYTCHLVCYNITGEQAEALQKSKRTYSKNYDGAFEIEYITPIVRSYDTLYDVGIRLVVYPNTFYKSDLIICYNSFMQNYREYLLASPGAEIVTTPLYYKEAEYRISTLVYHLADALRLKTTDDTVPTVLDTEAHYIKKSVTGMDPERISETTVHFFRAFLGILVSGLCTVAFVVLLEIEHMQYDFAVFSVFGADTRRLVTFLLYKLLLLCAVIQIPCAFLTTIIGLLLYGLRVFSVSPVIHLISMITILLIVPIPAARILAIRNRKSTIYRLSSTDNTPYVSSPRISHIFWNTDRFVLEYALVNLRRHVRFFCRLAAAAVTFSFMIHIAGFLITPKEDLPQYTVNFPTVMEYEVYENRFYPAVTAMENLTLTGEISAAGLSLEINGAVIENCTFIAAGEETYRTDPEIRETTEAGKIAVCMSRRAAKQYQLTPGSTVFFRKEEPLPLEVGTILPPEDRSEDGIRIYMSFPLYQSLIGEVSGEMLVRHIRLPGDFEPAESEPFTTVPYKSAQYTNDFTLKCEYDIPEEAVFAGDFSDVTFYSDAVGIRCSPSVYEYAGYEVGDSLSLSNTGRMKQMTKENVIPSALSGQLRNLSYSYEKLKIAAIILDENAGFEILVNPYAYESLTGCQMGYSSAAIDVTPDADTDQIWNELRKVSGNFYEVYITDNQTLRTNTLLAEYHRGAEGFVIITGAVLCMALILTELLTLFDRRRVVEMQMLRATGGDAKTIKKLRHGVYLPPLIVIFILIVIIIL